MARNKSKQKKPQAEPRREVDNYFEVLNDHSRHPVNRIIQYLFIPVFSFAVLGMIWMIPFPEIGFLKRLGYDTFVNWGSFFIAAMVYYYLRLAPTLSYAVLLTVGIFSFLIVQLEYLEQGGGPPVWSICALLLLVSLAALSLGQRLERPPLTVKGFLRLITLGPIWLWHFVFNKLRLPY